MRIAVWWEQDLWGGVDTHLLTLLRNWPDKSDQFIIFYNSGNQGIKRISSSLSQLDQVMMVSFPDPSSFLPAPFAKVARYFSLPLRFLLMKRRAQRLLARQGSFDVLFANNGGYPGAWGSLAALWAGAALGLRTRLLLVHHEATARGPLRHSFESLLDLGVQYWATDLVAVSRATRSTLIERRGFYTYLNPIRVIHNGVDTPTDSETLAVDLRTHLTIPADSFVVGMVGRLERYKGHEDLILALGELPSNKISQVVVVFVGGGDITEIERLQIIAQKIGVSSQVRFAGYVEGSIGILMRQFDLLAMLTKDFEGFGLTIAEAMWEGTPVLATMVGAVPEFVTEDVAILVQPEAPDEISDALVRVMDNEEEAQQRAIRARQHISKYSGQTMAKNFHRLLLVSGR
jgi:glycosyltransferase involved in cell wall biosynthesis